MKSKVSKILISIIAIIGIVLGLHALADSEVPKEVTTSKAEELSDYIRGTDVSLIKFSDNSVGYCYDLNKKVPNKMTLSLEGLAPAGLSYIVEHGNIFNDYRKNYYVIQTAIWWFLDDINGTNYLGNEFKTTAEDPNNLRPIIKKLVSDAKGITYQDPTISIDSSNITFDYDKETQEFVSSLIKVSGYNLIGNYTVSLPDTISNGKITDLEGNIKNSFSYNEKFRIRIANNNINSNNFNFKVTVSGVGTIYKLYLYGGNSEYQRIIQVLPNITHKNVKIEKDLTIKTSNLKVLKVDSDTNKPLKGAKFELYDLNDKLLYSFTTSEKEVEIVGLLEGTYKLKEVEAPNGYQMLEQFTTIKLTKDNNRIIIKNKKIKKETSLKIYKKDKENDSALVGAKLVLKDDKGNIILKWLTTDTYQEFKNLVPGKYYIYEEMAPSGYIVSSQEKEVLLEEGNSYVVTFYNQKEETPIPNKIIVRFHKLDVDNNNYVNGASIQITDKNGNIVDSFISNNTYYETTKLLPGTYFMEETSAPNGYSLYQGKIEFNVYDNSNIQDIYFYNSKIYDVPNTNSNLNKMAIIIGAIIIVIGLSIVSYNLVRVKNE